MSTRVRVAAIALLVVPLLLSGQTIESGAPHVIISPRPAGLAPLTAPSPLSSHCVLSSGSLAPPNEGPTDYQLHHVPTTPLNAIMIFVDFPDVPQSESTTSLYNAIVPSAVSYFSEVSYGLFTLNVTPIHKWYRMPMTAGVYGFADGLTFAEQKRYVTDAVGVSNAEVNFAGYGAIFVVSSNTGQIPISPTMLAYPGFGVTADGNELRLGITFGQDIRNARPNYGTHVLVHEVGHILGLPDLYEFGAPYPAFSRFAGGWDIMSFVATGAHFVAFHKFKFGWLNASNIACLGAGQNDLTLTPLENAGGLKAAMVPLSGSRAYLVEVRQTTGRDAGLCDRGVLVYLVDALIPTGSGPVVVRASQADTSSAQQNQCGYLYAAPYDIGAGEIGRFEDAGSQFSMEILSKSGSDYRVRIAYQSASCVAPAIGTQPQSQTIFSGGSATLTVSASGTQPLTFQWYRGQSGDTSAPVGTNSSQLVTGSLTQTTSYWVRVTNGCGQATSATATVTVASCDAPQITAHPENRTIVSGQTTTLTVLNIGTSPFTYQWYRGTAPDTSSPVGGSAQSYTTPALTQTTSYWVRVSNACGTVDSRSAIVTVTASCTPAAIGRQPEAKSVRWGETATLSVTATGSDPLAYQWYRGARGDTSVKVGTNSASFTTPPLTATASYWVRVTNACGSADSAAATVTVRVKRRGARR